jgi:nicotinamidase-related amidase
MAQPLHLDPARSALILIDLQNLIVGLQLVPHSGADILARCKALAARFRSAGALVVVIRAEMEDQAAALAQPVDQPIPHPDGPLAADWADLADDVLQPGDVLVRKRQWGGFYGTDLDLQLRRRDIREVAIAGIATNFGVESTARQAWEHGYSVVLPEDAMGSFTTELHATAIEQIFPKIARVRRSDELLFSA